MSILVTGGAGFIGTNFLYYWRKHYPNEKIIVLDSLTYAGRYHNLSKLLAEGLEFIKGDISECDLILRTLNQHTVTRIVHFAAESHVDRSIVEPDIFIETNVKGTHSLLKATLEHMELTGNSVHFHHISTDEVYGSLEESDPGFTELSRFQPNSPYSASKAASDHLVRSYHVTYGLPITISNCSNNYGPYQNQEKLIPLMIHNILKGIPLPIYGNGRNIRDWIYVEDHCRAIDKIIHHGKIGETYNVGGGEEISNIDLVYKICYEIKLAFDNRDELKTLFPDAPCAVGRENDSLINFVSDRKGHDFRYAIDSTKIQNELNFLPQYTLMEGLAQTVHWYIQQKIGSQMNI